MTACGFAGCLGPGSPDECAVACSSSGACPGDFVCRADNRCYSSPQVPLCVVDGDGGIVDATPRDGAASDAPPAACLATGCSEPTSTCNTAPTSASFGVCIPDGTLSEVCSAASRIGSGREAGAPAIWRAQLLRIDDCAATQRGYQLTVDYFDPTGNGPQETSSAIVMRAEFGFTSPPLSLLATGFAFVGADGTSGTMINAPCVNADPVPDTIAVRLVDDAGKQSNTVCLDIAP